MNLNLSQKERYLLEDQKSHEEACIYKYTNHSNLAKDLELKQLFNQYLGQEQQHLDTINKILNGQIPQINQQSQQNQNQSTQAASGTDNQKPSYDKQDEILCTDALMAEKYVSSVYNTAIFEFADANIRQILNHIQKEEQQHGEGIYNYMKRKGMYNTNQ